LLTCITIAPLQAQESYYVGASVCRSCHQDSEQNHATDPFNKWLLSKHARAYAVLFNQHSLKIAKLSGIDVSPAQSPVCLGCHSTASDVETWRRDKTFFSADGIQCELCHGPGSTYLESHVDKKSSNNTGGPRLPDEAFCRVCHKPMGSHTAVLPARPFDFQRFGAAIKHSGKAVSPAMEKPSAQPARHLIKECVACHRNAETLFKDMDHPARPNRELQYKTPSNLVLSSDGTRLYVACESSDSLMVIDTGSQKPIKEIPVGNQPHGVCLDPAGKKLYVSNRGSDNVSVIDVGKQTVSAVFKVGDEPHGLILDPGGSTLYVANAGSNDISVIDPVSGTEQKRLAAGRGAWGIASQGRSLYITNNLSHFVKFREPSVSEVTIVDTDSAVVDKRVMIPGANLVQGAAAAPGGDYVLVTLIRTKNLIPITRVMQGWMITNGLGVIWKDGRVDQILLDETEHYFADPTAVVIGPDGKRAYVTGGGIDAVAVVDLEKMIALIRQSDETQRRRQLPNHLGIAAQYVVTRVGVGRSPRGLAVSPDGKRVYVADGLDDTISVIDTESLERAAVIDLGGPADITLQRKGERLFHSARITYGRQYSCHTCHPDGSIDGITYDIEPDGLGFNPVDNRTLRGILDTAPFKWTGKNQTLSRQCGPRLAVFFTRIEPFQPEQVIALERYICTIPRNPNRYRTNRQLTPAQRRGKTIFQRERTNSGTSIPFESQCHNCHSGPYHTNRQSVDVGTASPLDTQGKFDVPHLNNIYETAPYLHDGRARTLEEIWTRYNPEDTHGITNDLTKDQLNDLIEYLKTL